MTSDDRQPCRLSPEVQARYQQVFNDPSQRGSAEWLEAGRALADAGLIAPDTETEPAREQAIRDLNVRGSS